MDQGTQITLRYMEIFASLLTWGSLLTLCMLDNFACFFVVNFLIINFFKKNLSRILVECQTV